MSGVCFSIVVGEMSFIDEPECYIRCKILCCTYMHKSLCYDRGMRKRLIEFHEHCIGIWRYMLTHKQVKVVAISMVILLPGISSV